MGIFNFKNKKVERHGRRNHPVARLLEDNQGIAFTVERISELTGMNLQTVRSILRALRSDGYVDHQKPFFYWK